MTPPFGDRDDAALVAATLAGNDAAFTALMQRHKGALHRFVRLYVGDADEALDLVQETFLAAWKALDRFDSRRAMTAWLRQIALNKCRDWGRRRKVRAFFYGASELDYDISSGAGAVSDGGSAPTAPPAEEGRRERRLLALEAAIAALPAPLRAALILTAIEGLSHEQAGAALGVTAKAVETRVYRARQDLRRRLDLD